MLEATVPLLSNDSLNTCTNYVALIVQLNTERALDGCCTIQEPIVFLLYSQCMWMDLCRQCMLVTWLKESVLHAIGTELSYEMMDQITVDNYTSVVLWS